LQRLFFHALFFNLYLSENLSYSTITRTDSYGLCPPSPEKSFYEIPISQALKNPFQKNTSLYIVNFSFIIFNID